MDPQSTVPVQTVSPQLAHLRGRTGMIVAGTALAAFGVLFAAVKRKRADDFDVALTLRIQGRRHRSLGLLMETISWPGFPPQSRVIPPVIVAAEIALGLPTEAAFQVLAWGSALIASVVKGFVHRPRPLPEQVSVVLQPLGGSSFPSGHVLTYVGTYGMLAFLTYSHVRNPEVRWLLTVGLVGLVGLVGPSRIYQGHHWPTDVAASYLLGLSYLIALLALYRRVKAAQAASARD